MTMTALHLALRKQLLMAGFFTPQQRAHLELHDWTCRMEGFTKGGTLLFASDDFKVSETDHGIDVAGNCPVMMDGRLHYMLIYLHFDLEPMRTDDINMSNPNLTRDCIVDFHYNFGFGF
jgi:hypothetical protein